MNHIKTHEDFFNMVNDTGSILKFLIENNICSKRFKCPNKKCKKPRKNILSLKNERLFYKCNSFGCSRWWSANNNIFNFKTKSQLSVKQILSIIWFYCHSFKLKDVIMQTGIARKHIIKWWCKIRNYLHLLLLQAPPMGGKGYVVQIDESLFRGRRKYKVGKFKTGDIRPQRTVRDILDSLISNNRSKRNYGNRVDGPWVFGMVIEKKSELKSKVSMRKEIKRQKKLFVRSLYPNDKKKRQGLYKDNRIFQRKFEATRLKQLLKQSTTTNQEFIMFVVQRQ